MTTNAPTVFKKFDLIYIGLILIVAFLLRLYPGLNVPLTDWHSWRQADTAAVARNFLTTGFDLLHPKYDDLSNVQTGQYNPEGYRFVEFPIYNASFAFLYKYIPIMSLEAFGRIITIFSSLVLIVVIYYLVLKEEGRTAALFSAIIFSIMPFFVYYSRVVLPDMTSLSLIFLSVFCVYKAVQKNNTTAKTTIFLLIGAIFCSLSVLVKPMTIFYFIAILYLFYQKYNTSMFKQISFYLFFAIAIIPFILWRFWMLQYPVGVVNGEWLIATVNTSEGLKNIFMRPSYFRIVFYERILDLILGGLLFVPMVIGILKKPTKSLLFYFIGIGSLLYLMTFQGGNVQHDYYQIMILPSLAIFCGIGINFLFTNTKLFSSIILNILTVVIFCIASFYFSYFSIKDYYSYNYDLVNIGKIVNTLTTTSDKIVTDTTGDTTLLYLTGRKGFPSLSDSLQNLKLRGATYFVTLNQSSMEQYKNTYKIIFQNEKVYIFDLNQPAIQ